MANGTYETVKIERDTGENTGLTWVILNRPEKRNAMSPQLHFDMANVLDELESDAQTKLIVLTGAGEAWCAGQDLKLYFRELDNKPAERARASWASHYWRWQKLFTYPKPTIAMVNGFCFGGGFTQLIACDFAIAAEDAKFGLSEVNWGILPGGFVSKALTDALGLRDAVWLAMTGETFDGKMAEKIRLINKAVPRDKLRDETIALAQRLMKLNPEVLKATKLAIKNVRAVPHEQAADYLQAKSQEMRFQDKEGGRAKGMSQFLDDKSYRAFHQPILVLADTALLDTLPEREFRAGYAELVKYGLLGDADFFAWLEKNWREVFAGGPAREQAIAEGCGEGGERGARRARDRRPRFAQSRPHFRPRAGSGLRLLRPAPPRRGDRRRHGAGLRILGAAAGLAADGGSQARHPPFGRSRPADAFAGHSGPATLR